MCSLRSRLIASFSNSPDAEIAQELGILTVAVVTKPFEFEQKAKMRQAEAGIAELKKHVDSLIVIPNERLLQSADKE